MLWGLAAVERVDEEGQAAGAAPFPLRARACRGSEGGTDGLRRTRALRRGRARSGDAWPV